VLSAALLLRIGLASQGWPPSNSDEATLGLMTQDILRHGAHPVFFYGQHYMGALQAYLAVPTFALLGPTVFALHVTTTLQFTAFLLLLYALTRLIYSPAVAILSIFLLAIGPPEALFFELRAGAGTQDTLFFGTLLLLLTYLRLQRSWRVAARVALALGIGAAAGLGLWADLLILPFLLAAAVALGLRAASTRASAVTGRRLRLLALEAGAAAAGCCIGAAPLLVANIMSRGATLAQTLAIAGLSGSKGPASGGLLLPLLQQAAGTLLVAVPRALGSATVCDACAAWPVAHFAGSPQDAVGALLSELPFTLCTVGVFALTLREQADAFGRWKVTGDHRGGRAWIRRLQEMDVRWWGRSMLVVVAGATVLACLLSPLSFDLPTRTDRYLVGIYLAMPLLAALVWRAVPARRIWRSAVRDVREAPARISSAAWLAGALVAAILILDAAGIGQKRAEIGALRAPGGASAAREIQLATFLNLHGSARFYTTYWVCNLTMFETEQHVQCAVVRDGDAFAPGLNRVPDGWTLLQGTAHPAYVFDVRAAGGGPPADRQIASALQQRDPRLNGYAYAREAGYDVYYYAKQ
jgi:hypothetical protein